MPIVEQTMRQAYRAVAVTLAGAALWAAVPLSERLWSAEKLARAAERVASAHEVSGRHGRLIKQRDAGRPHG